MHGTMNIKKKREHLGSEREHNTFRNKLKEDLRVT